MQRGAIYLHTNFQFKDSFFGSKYIILLTDPQPDVSPLFLKVTSQQKDKPTKAGCIEEHKLFFLPAKTTYFPLNTWIQLYEVYEIHWIEKDKEARVVGTLPGALIDDIIKCLLYSCDDDIMPIHRRVLSSPPKRSSPSLQTLADRFNKGRL